MCQCGNREESTKRSKNNERCIENKGRYIGKLAVKAIKTFGCLFTTDFSIGTLTY
jgi:hypothetical protein